jgi:hypothetical protein
MFAENGRNNKGEAGEEEPCLAWEFHVKCTILARK